MRTQNTIQCYPVWLALFCCILLGATVPFALAQDEGAADNSRPVDKEAPPEPTDLDRAEEMLRTMEAELDSITLIQSQARDAADEELQLLRIKAARHLAGIKNIQPNLIKFLPGLDPEDSRTAAVQTGFQEFLISKFEVYELAIIWWSREIETLRGQRPDADQQSLGEIETRIGSARDRLDELWSDLARILQVADDQGMDTAPTYERFERTLKARAEDLLGRLQIAARTRNELKDQIQAAERAKSPESEISPLRTSLQYSEARVGGVARSLEFTLDMLVPRGFDATLYRQEIIKSTGEISERVLDPKVVVGLAREFLGTMVAWIKDRGPTYLVKLLIIIASVVFTRLLFRIGWWLLRLVGLVNLTKLMLQLGHSLLNPVATFVGLFIGLWLIGANPTTLLTGAGVGAVIIGFALQDSLANLAAGFFILATRPFDLGDVIMTGGVVGTVKAMWIANTTVVTFDGRRLLIPNKKIWADVIENRSVEPNRRVDITVRVGFDEDINRAIAILHDLVANEDRLLKNPEPSVFVSTWKDSWVEIAVRPWARNENWWAMLTDLPRQVALRFADEGIDIPFPRIAMTDSPQFGSSSGKESK